MSRSLIPGLTHLVRRGRPRRTLPFEPVIEALALTELQKLFLRDRWLASVRWFEQAARVNQRLSTLLRLVMVVGGVALPAFIGTLTGDGAGRLLRYLTLTISAPVGMSGPLEQLYHAHDRWRLYRFTTELLTSEGWQFLN